MHKIMINDHAHVGEARRLATILAEEMGFDEREIAKIAIIVTEAAMNIIKHVKSEGEILLEAYQDRSTTELQVYAIDQGPGVLDMALCFQDGYSTAQTAGTGLGALKRLASQLDFYSSPEKGTVLWAKIEKNIPLKKDLLLAEKTPTFLEWNVICVPVVHEKVSGDAWASSTLASDIQLFMVVDGLGHGPEAHMAATEAVRLFHETSQCSLSDILNAQHAALRKTRGAAVAIIKIDMTSQEATYLGVGNISGTILTPEKHYNMLSYNGIVGHQFRTIHEMKYPFTPQSILVMHSDGLSNQWERNCSSELLRQSTPTLSGILYRDFQRKRDDACVLVAKVKPS